MWQIFYGNATNTSAEVYARWFGEDSPDASVASSLKLKGPYSSLARTLPSSFQFRRQSDRLWHTTVVDPCFWGPESPSTYRISGNDQLEQTAAMYGIRRLGARGDHLWLDGRRWVFRAARGRSPSENEWFAGSACRESLIGRACRISDGELEQHSLNGIPTAVHVDAELAADSAKLVNMGHAAALTMWVLSGETATNSVAEELQRHCPNQLLATELTGSDELPSWAHVLICPTERELLSLAIEDGRPVIALDHQPMQCGSPTDVRRACEALQRQLAPNFDLAGYWVTLS